MSLGLEGLRIISKLGGVEEKTRGLRAEPLWPDQPRNRNPSVVGKRLGKELLPTDARKLLDGSRGLLLLLLQGGGRF